MGGRGEVGGGVESSSLVIGVNPIWPSLLLVEFSSNSLGMYSLMVLVLVEEVKSIQGMS